MNSPDFGLGNAQNGSGQPQFSPEQAMVQQQMQIRRMLNDPTTKAVQCHGCASPFFKQVVVLNKISNLVTGNQKPTIIPTEVFVCENCGAPTKELGLPKTIVNLLEQANGEEE